MCHCTSENLEIPGSRCACPGMTGSHYHRSRHCSHREICTHAYEGGRISGLQMAFPSPIPACPSSPPARITQPRHAQDRLQTDGCTVDGGLAVAHLGDGGRRPRGAARNQRIRTDGSALAHRLPVVVAVDLPRRRPCRAEDIAASRSRRATSSTMSRSSAVSLR